MKSLTLTALAFASLALSHLPAQIVISDSPDMYTLDGPKVINTLTTGVNVDGYAIEVQTDPSHGAVVESLPTFISSANFIRTYPAGGTNLTLNGTTVQTGFSYNGGASPTGQVSFTLGSGTPSSFDVGILTDNSSYPANDNSYYEAELFSSTGDLLSTAVVNDTLTGKTLTNDFYFFKVVGGKSGDSVTVVATGEAGAGFTTIGGVIFVPEPSSFALVLGGVAVLLCASAMRFRRSV